MDQDALPALLDALLWGILRTFPGVEEDFSQVPLGGDRVGAEAPSRWAAQTGAQLLPEPEGGLLPELDALLPGAALHPQVLDFYTRTARYQMPVVPRWLPGLRLAGALWSRLWGRRWGQLELPLGPAPLHSQVHRVQGTNQRWWVRSYTGSDRVLYTSRVELVRLPSEPQPLVQLIFPVPGGAWVVRFRAVLDGDAVVLTEQGGRPPGPGLYVVRAGGPARYVRLHREEIRVSPTETGCRVVHRLWFAGIPFLTLSYEATL